MTLQYLIIHIYVDFGLNHLYWLHIRLKFWSSVLLSNSCLLASYNWTRIVSFLASISVFLYRETLYIFHLNFSLAH